MTLIKSSLRGKVECIALDIEEFPFRNSKCASLELLVYITRGIGCLNLLAKYVKKFVRQTVFN